MKGFKNHVDNQLILNDHSPGVMQCSKDFTGVLILILYCYCQH